MKFLPSKIRFRFSLKTFLLFTLIFGLIVPIIWTWDTSRKRDRYVEEIKKRGAKVVYSWQANSQWRCETFTPESEPIGEKPSGFQRFLHGNGKVVYLVCESPDAAHLNRIDWFKNDLRFLRIPRATNMDYGVLRELGSLEVLSLGHSDISDAEPLTNLKNLRWLNLYDTKITSIESLSGLTKLERLVLSETKIHDLTPLQDLHQLRWLELHGTDVSNLEGLENLRKLEDLNLMRTRVKTLKPLHELKALDRLIIDDFPRGPTEADVDRLRLALPDLNTDIMPSPQQYKRRSQGPWGTYRD